MKKPNRFGFVNYGGPAKPPKDSVPVRMSGAQLVLAIAGIHPDDASLDTSRETAP